MLIQNIEIWVTKDTWKPDFLKKHMSPSLLLYAIWKLRLRASKLCATRLWDFFLTETKELPICALPPWAYSLGFSGWSRWGITWPTWDQVNGVYIHVAVFPQKRGGNCWLDPIDISPLNKQKTVMFFGTIASACSSPPQLIAPLPELAQPRSSKRICN